MKKIHFFAIAIIALFSSCNDTANDSLHEESLIDMSDFYVFTDSNDDPTSKSSSEKEIKKSCFTMNLLNKELQSNPGIEKKMYDIEYHTRKLISAKKPSGVGNGNGGNDGGVTPTPFNGTVSIPVYVHIIYSKDVENLSLEQIKSQIAVLNKDFSNTNSDLISVPAFFSGDVGNANIQFTLAGVTRTFNSKTSWPLNNTMKYDSYGGHDAIDTSKYLNIWVVNIFDGNQTLGFAYLPGSAPAGADGVVIASPYFGDTGTAGSVFSEFGLGRTTTHEVGHYLNLRHIWGDGRCRQDDLVADTPSSDRPNYYCPDYPTIHCQSTDMTMNYMDYVDDACMYMFSKGQTDRMRALFASGGARESLIK